MNWKLEDIQCGRLVCSPLNLDIKDKSYRMGCFAKWAYKIGYSGGGDRIVLVNLADGMTHPIKTPMECRRWLRENGMVPMRRDWYDELNNFLAESSLMLASPND